MSRSIPGVPESDPLVYWCRSCGRTSDSPRGIDHSSKCPSQKQIFMGTVNSVIHEVDWCDHCGQQWPASAGVKRCEFCYNDLKRVYC